MTDTRNYHLTYNITPHPEGIPLDQARKLSSETGCGVTDALLVALIFYGGDGSSSHCFVGMDGRTGEDLAPAEVFKTWMMLGSQLADDERLSPIWRMIAGGARQRVRLFLEAHKRARAGRPIEPGEPTDDGLAAEAAKFLRRLPADLADLDADTLAGCLEGARGLLRQLAALAGER